MQQSAGQCCVVCPLVGYSHYSQTCNYKWLSKLIKAAHVDCRYTAAKELANCSICHHQQSAHVVWTAACPPQFLADIHSGSINR